MKTPILLLLLSACASTTSTRYEQAAPAYVPVGPPPVMTPGYFPGTPAQPVHTPNGAGLPGERGPMPQPHALPASPNKRALPDEFSPKREAGIWAADGAQNSPELPRLFGVAIPYPGPAQYPDAKGDTELCVDTLTNAARVVGVFDRIMSLPEDVRACLAARALRHCAGEEMAYRRKMAAAKERLGPLALQDIKTLVQHAGELFRANCRPEGLGQGEAGADLGAVLRRWDDARKDYL
jgi:hypothetical protein